ncbi:YlmC/YmxH family sporulation protein [Brevibacillus dissolubilis]|uniref:YlmC/YmxH family sporulation protein n=1 Tax=Brevibacillus dissolubilis TaxID=1844116 RepID=UPI001115EAA1|nr:YlmC/YmxH family sporulation protein [Brevibacillus dissolubilis]
MRLSEFSGKEIIDLDNGERRGQIGQSDMEINPQTGEIRSIILPGGSFFGFGKRRDDIVIPWSSIVKIGPEMIIVELNGQNNEATLK